MNSAPASGATRQVRAGCRFDIVSLARLNGSGCGPREGVENPFVEWGAAQPGVGGVEPAFDPEVDALARTGLDVLPIDSHRWGAEEAPASSRALVGNPPQLDVVACVGFSDKLAQAR